MPLAPPVLTHAVVYVTLNLYRYLFGELIVIRYVAESIAMIAGRFGQ